MSPFRTFFLAVFALGCSSTSFDVAPSADAATDAADSATSDTATSEVATGDAGSFECRDPSTCGPARQHCCANFKLGAGSIPSCPMVEASSKCQAVCVTQIPLSCPSPGQVKVCRSSADCASDAQNPKCCKIFAGGVLGSVCASELISSYALSCN